MVPRADREPLADLTYSELVNKLFPRLTGGIRWGLERTRELLATIGNPHEQLRSVHVAGTNGKGSVSATIASVMRATGLETGLYTSPHLCSFRERIRINGAPISEQELLEAARPLIAAFDRTGASFFEATTVLAFSALARQQVDAAVIEVGLGGRLDATNVITPELSVITNIALDHADYLGNTLTGIAAEKAGIIKPGVPVLTAETNPDVIAVFQERADAVNAPLQLLGDFESVEVGTRGSRLRIGTNSWGTLEVFTPLAGRHQARNAALAVAAADHVARRFGITRTAVEKGVATVSWPGRFQIVAGRDHNWVFDVAHNEAGAAALADTFRELDLPRPVSLLVGILGDKDWSRMLPRLFALADQVTLTVPPTAPANRVWRPEEALAQVPHTKARIEPDFELALQDAAKAGRGGTVLVTGSFHTVGDALAVIGQCEAPPDFALPHNSFSG